MSSRFVIEVVLQLAVPLPMLAWQAMGRATTIVAWSLQQVAVWSYIYATSVAPTAPNGLILTGHASTAAVCVAVLWMAQAGRTPPGETAVDLTFLLRLGRYKRHG